MPAQENRPAIERLTITLEKLCFIMRKLRQFTAKDELTDPGDSSNATDDGMRSVLEDHHDDPGLCRVHERHMGLERR